MQPEVKGHCDADSQTSVSHERTAKRHAGEHVNAKTSAGGADHPRSFYGVTTGARRMDGTGFSSPRASDRVKILS